jgi:putative endopeptidase
MEYKFSLMKTSLWRGLLALPLFSLLLVGCNADGSMAEETVERGIILSNMDTTVSPKDDFYNYVNGTWMKETKIPDDRSYWGGFSVLRKSTDQDVLDIIAKAKEENRYEDGTDQAKAIAMFNGQMDTLARNELGITPLKSALDDIASIESLADMQRVLATNNAISQPFFGITAFADLNNSTVNAAYLAPQGLGLPDRDYYLEQDTKSKEIREEYVQHVARMLQFLGDEENTALAAARKVLDFETQLAEPRFDKVQSRDPRNFNNRHSIAEVQEMLPSVDLEQLMTDMNIKEPLDSLIVMQPEYTMALQSFLITTPVEDLKTMLRWSTIRSAANMLTTETNRANWEFYGKYLNGSKEQRPADERALATVNGNLGEALGKVYVDEKFPPEAKAKAETMIANIIKAFQMRIEKLDWMTEETKANAIAKLDKFTVKIGNPMSGKITPTWR